MFPVDIHLSELNNFNRIGIAFSGGLDSSALLKYITENFPKKEKIYALHINHGISKYSDTWEDFCRDQASILGINFRSWQLRDLKKTSENTLRDHRYKIFSDWSNKDDLIVTGHHADDQIETLLFRIFRGTGINGLIGIKEYSTNKNLNILRPFIHTRKEVLLRYAKESKLDWIEDDSNNQNYYSRNIIRNLLVPKIIQRWPELDKSLLQLSSRAKITQEILEDIAKEDLKKINISDNSIDRNELHALKKERQENLLYFWLTDMKGLKISSKQLNEITSCILNSTQGSAMFELISKEGILKTRLFISSNEINLIDIDSIINLPKDLSINWNLKDLVKIPTGEISIKETKGKGLDKKFICSGAVIKSREGGERCKPYGRDKSQKLKNLFQEYKVPDWKRDQIPLIYIDKKLAAVGDLWVCEEFHAASSKPSISIIWNEYSNQRGG